MTVFGEAMLLQPVTGALSVPVRLADAGTPQQWQQVTLTLLPHGVDAATVRATSVRGGPVTSEDDSDGNRPRKRVTAVVAGVRWDHNKTIRT